MKRRSNKMSMNFCIICLLVLVVILMGIYIIGSMTRKSSQQNQNNSYVQPEVVTTAFVDYDYYNFMPRRLFRNFYESDYYDYREKPVIIQQDTKPIYINVPSSPSISQSSQPAQQNNLNLYNYSTRPEPPQTTSTESFQINVPTAPSISPPPLSAVSPSSLSSDLQEV